jgi:hypothetical protein
MDSAGGEVKFAGAKLRALRVREIDAAKLEASELPSAMQPCGTGPPSVLSCSWILGSVLSCSWILGNVLVLPELGVRASASTSRVDGGSWRMG